MLTASTRSKASGSVPTTVPAMFSAALETRISRLPKASAAALANWSTESPSARSSGMATASPPAARMPAAVSSQAGSRRAPSTTGCPAAASARAVASPMPEDAPVTTAGRRSGWGSKRGHQRRVDRGRQGGQPPDVDRVDPLDPVGVDLVVRHPGDQLAEGDPGLEPGEGGAHAEVAPAAEAHQLGGVAVEVVAVGLGEDRLVPVGRAHQQQHPVPARRCGRRAARGRCGPPGAASGWRCRNGASPPPSRPPGRRPGRGGPAGRDGARPSTRRCRAAWWWSRCPPPPSGRGRRRSPRRSSRSPSSSASVSAEVRSSLGAARRSSTIAR